MTAFLLAAAILAAGHDDYDTREAASKALARLVRDDPARFGPAVSQAAGFSPSPEARARCSRLTGPYFAHVADTYAPPAEKWPCADWSGLLPDSWQAWMPGCESGQASECSPGWCRYRRATEAYVRSQLRCGCWSAADADAAVRAGWLEEIRITMERYPDQVAQVESWSRR